MLASKFVYANGRSTPIAVPALSSIAVQSQSARCAVFQQVGYPNQPNTLSLLGIVGPNQEIVFPVAGGGFAAAASIIIDAGAAPAAYSVGISPRVLANAAAQSQGAPGVLNATGTLTAAMILSGIVTSTAGAAVAATLDTGAIMDTNIDMNIGDSFDWSVIVTGANAFTVTASAGHTLVGNVVVAANSSARFRTRKTAVGTYITYANPTPIS